MDTALSYNRKTITAKDILRYANDGRSLFHRALVVRGVQEQIITQQELQELYRWITKDVVKQWSLDAEVLVFFPKITKTGDTAAAEQAPTLAKPAVVKSSPRLEYKGLSLNPEQGTLWWKTRSVSISHREKTVLPLFFSQPNTMISRDAIFEALTKREYNNNPQLPDEVMSEVRLHCRDLGISPIPLLKVRGGYKLTITQNDDW